jgi:hypothetical protein
VDSVGVDSVGVDSVGVDSVGVERVGVVRVAEVRVAVTGVLPPPHDVRATAARTPRTPAPRSLEPAARAVTPRL